MHASTTTPVTASPTVISTGSGRQRRWYVAQQSLAGLLASGPYRSAHEASAAASSPRPQLALAR